LVLYGLARLASILASALLAGCASQAHYPLNEPFAATPAIFQPTSPQQAPALPSSDSLPIVLAFSGGGTRAAALSYGVLETLSAQEIVWDGRARRLHDEVDIISTVSGGSFTAAYFGLRGEASSRSSKQPS